MTNRVRRKGSRTGHRNEKKQVRRAAGIYRRMRFCSACELIYNKSGKVFLAIGRDGQ